MEIPIQCRRSKGENIVTTTEFIKALEQTCNWKKAERLPDDSFLELFIGSDVLRSMESPDNQIIWGRRGTGKTHLLKAFVQKINDDGSNKSMAFYVSCDKISIDSPLGANFTSDHEKMKVFARNTFICFLNNLMEQIVDTYESLLHWKDFYREYDEDILQAIKNDVESQLYNLLDNCSYGIPIAIEKQKEVVESNKEEEQREKNTLIEASVGISYPRNLVTSIKGKRNKEHKNTKNMSHTKEVKSKEVYAFNLSETRAILENLVEALNIDMLYVCIDELWLIDQKGELSLQPLFLEYIRQAFLSSSKISVKIASIREVTKLSSKAIAENNFGLQSGHDIIELINLDTKYITKKDRITHYKNILYKRINYFINKNNNNSTNQYDIQYIVESIFKSDSNLDSLITLTHIIPRNFFVVLQRALTIIKYDVQHCFVHQYLIREIVIKTYLEDKRASLPLNDNSLFSAINTYINNSNNYFFMIKLVQIRRLKSELNNLIYTEIIHQIPSSALPALYMDNYKGFYIDSGKFLHTLLSKGVSLNNSSLYDFNYILPKCITDNIEDYIINLDAIESDFVECENCSSQVSRKHPVYIKAKICPNCAYDLK